MTLSDEEVFPMVFNYFLNGISAENGSFTAYYHDALCVTQLNQFLRGVISALTWVWGLEHSLQLAVPTLIWGNLIFGGEKTREGKALVLKPCCDPGDEVCLSKEWPL